MGESRHLYNPEGQWVAFLVGNDLFWRDGERLGWLQSVRPDTTQAKNRARWRGGMIKTYEGKQIGVVTAGGVIELWPQALQQTH